MRGKENSGTLYGRCRALRLALSLKNRRALARVIIRARIGFLYFEMNFLYYFGELSESRRRRRLKGGRHDRPGRVKTIGSTAGPRKTLAGNL